MPLFILFLPHLAPVFAGTVESTTTESEIISWAGSGSDSDPRGLAALSDGRLVWFEDDSSFSSSKEDAIYLLDPDETGSARFEIIASEAELKALAATTSEKYIFAGDVAVDADDNVYAIATEYNSGKTVVNNFLVKIPYDGTNFGNPILLTYAFEGGMVSSKTYHRLAVHGDDLYLLYDNQDASDDYNDTNGVYHFDLSGTLPGDETDLSLVASYLDLANALEPSPGVGDDIGLFQIRTNSDGHIFAIVDENDAGTEGDLVKIDPATGAVSVFLSQAEAELETGISGVFDATTNLAISPVNDHFFFFETGAGDLEDMLMFELDEDGKYVGQATSYHQILEEVSTVNEEFTTKGSNCLAVDGNGKIHLFLVEDDEETLITVDPSGTCSDSFNFFWPTGSATASDVDSPYGPRNSGGYDFHRGIDLKMPIGTPIYAIEDGVVAHVETKSEEDCNGVSYTEYWVAVRHGSCPPYVYSYYMHLSEVEVSEGDTVTKGDPSSGNHIAESGQSASCNAHLHLEVRSGGMSKALCRNPLEFLPYTDNTPPSAQLVGSNDETDDNVLHFSFAVAPDEADLNGVELDWDGSISRWDWVQMNRDYGPAWDRAVDQPVVDYENGTWSALFPKTNSSATASRIYNYVIAGLPTTSTSGTITVEDVQTGTADTTVSAASADVTLSPSTITETADEGDDVELTFTFENDGATSVEVDLEISSATKQDIDIDSADESFTLTAGASRTVVITVTMDNSLPDGIGDAVLVSAELSSGENLVALCRIDRS